MSGSYEDDYQSAYGTERPDPATIVRDLEARDRSYARPRVAATPRVAVATSNPLRKGDLPASQVGQGIATSGPPRWSSERTKAAVRSAQPFRYPRLADDQLRDLCDAYSRITGDPVRRPAKANLLAACWRVHGDDTLPLIQAVFESTGTPTNLLGIVRSYPYRDAGTVIESPEAEHEPPQPVPAIRADRLDVDDEFMQAWDELDGWQGKVQ